jgi:predicted negative regulator of RcsB-dependent stress response
MFWLFAGCLLALIALFAWKRYEQSRGNYVALVGLRQTTDERMESMQRLMMKGVRRFVSSVQKSLYKVFRFLRLKLVKALRRVANYLEK